MKRIEFTPELLGSLPLTKEDARARGERYYLSDKPCARGHLPVRKVVGGSCFFCKRESTRLAAERRRRSEGKKVFELTSPLPIGMSHGMLTATGGFKREKSTERLLNRFVCFHEVQCGCGATFWVRADQWGKTETCLSCKQAKAGYKHGLSRKIEMTLWEAARQRARKFGTKFSIKVTDIQIPKCCPILGVSLDTRLGVSPSRKPRPNAPSLDRLDSTEGYTRDNLVVMSYRANVLKKDGTAEEHLKVAEFMENMGIANGG